MGGGLVSIGAALFGWEQNGDAPHEQVGQPIQFDALLAPTQCVVDAEWPEQGVDMNIDFGSA